MESTVSDLNRLKLQQKKILNGIDARITELQKFSADYQALDNILADLPKRLAHKGSIIPFGGRKGLVRADIIDTNEILVFLGSDHFATMTCYQARQLVERRAKAIKVQIEASAEERKLFSERFKFTDAFSKEQGESGVVDIREEETEEEEKRWMERHRTLLRQRKGESKKDDDEELWKRLERLEMAEDDESDEDTESENEKSTEIIKDEKSTTQHGILSSPTRRKSLERSALHVRFSVNEDDDDEEEEERPKTIRFRHSVTEVLQSTGSITPASIIQSVHTHEAGDSVPTHVDRVVETQGRETSQTEEVSQPQRPVSRFRAQRLNKKS